MEKNEKKENHYYCRGDGRGQCIHYYFCHRDGGGQCFHYYLAVANGSITTTSRWPMVTTTTTAAANGSISTTTTALCERREFLVFCTTFWFFVHFPRSFSFCVPLLRFLCTSLGFCVLPLVFFFLFVYFSLGFCVLITCFSPASHMPLTCLLINQSPPSHYTNLLHTPPPSSPPIPASPARYRPLSTTSHL